jgi:hypothetical protein
MRHPPAVWVWRLKALGYDADSMMVPICSPIDMRMMFAGDGEVEYDDGQLVITAHGDGERHHAERARQDIEVGDLREFHGAFKLQRVFVLYAIDAGR